MKAPNWMIYGAYGFTGKLVLQEAIKRGHKPVLAGRSEAKLAPLAERLGLERIRVDLDDQGYLREAVEGFELVFHAAGPFQFTGDPMMRACLASATNYIDITGEIPVFQKSFSYDPAAKEAGIAMISGAGIDVIPTDCMANYVAEKLPGAVELEIALHAGTRPSAGTVKSSLEMLPRGGMRRRGGKLVPHRLGDGGKQVRFSHREMVALPVSWGDLETAYRSTGIPNITTYMAYPPRLVNTVRRFGSLAQRLLSVSVLRRTLRALVDYVVQGPTEEMRQTRRSYVWVRARDREGNHAQAWLETLEGYRFTAECGVRCVERLLEERPKGALTPAQAFGTDLVMEIDSTKRMDTLPGDDQG